MRAPTRTVQQRDFGALEIGMLVLEQTAVIVGNFRSNCASCDVKSFNNRASV